MALQAPAQQWLDMYGIDAMMPQGLAQTAAGSFHALQFPSDTASQAIQTNMPADSLASAFADSAADTLAVGVTDIQPFAFMHTVADTLTVTAEKMFGAASYVPQTQLAQSLSDLTRSFLTDSLVFKLVVLLCFAGYCITLYLYRQQASALLGVFRSKLYVDNLLDERNYTFDNFLNSLVSLGILTLSLAIVKAADMLAGADMAGTLPGWAVFLLAPVAWVLLGLIFLYQTLVLKISGTLTYSGKFISNLRYIRKIDFSVAAVLLTPFFLMFSTSAESDARAISYIIIAVLCAIVIFHLARTWMLFVDEKISKLYWFLYLCAVEIFPVTFLLLSVRKFLS